MNFNKFFTTATGKSAPYPYQQRLATAESLPEVLSVPTGVGKTATAVLGWLFRRRYAADEIRQQTPRRLVFCLPMRTLVEQTRDECLMWIENLKPAGHDLAVHLLMGGENSEDQSGAAQWDDHPERDAIIIGTQDMLLSRALNRGYGMSRYRWPMHFGLLNNDCLWVLDETQLMGVGLTTSVQLAGLRQKLGTYANCQTLWMSATLNNAALETVDHRQPSASSGLELNEDDFANERIQQLINAEKAVSTCPVQLNKTTEKQYAKSVAQLITERHQPNTLTLVVINNVARAQAIAATISKTFSGPDETPEIHLIHSRYRPAERQEKQTVALNEKTVPAAGRILIATQAIEAGVDISSTTLITELAPWPSLVQRFGRCNRRGTAGKNSQPDADVIIIDIDTSDGKKSKFTLPYEPEQLDLARKALAELSDVGPESLKQITVAQQQLPSHVLRRKDLIDLFDTTADLSGNDLDVSRYIRDSDDTDVQVYWRAWDLEQFPNHPPRPGVTAGIPHLDFPAADRNELCNVSIIAMKAFADKLKKNDQSAWTWDPLSQEWNKAGKYNIRPGMTLLLHVEAGGYDADLGWTADPSDTPPKLGPFQRSTPRDAMIADDLQGHDKPLTITQHLADVRHHAEKLREVDFDSAIPWDAILQAASWHDVGKAHAAFQTAMLDFQSVPRQTDMLWAKAGEQGMPNYRIPIPVAAAQTAAPQITANHETTSQQVALATDVLAATTATATVEQQYQNRRGFRHELASALAWLHFQNYTNNATTNLVAYLIAAHHGKVRLSIRSMPNETAPRNNSKKFARGLHEGDLIPSVTLPNGQQTSAFKVQLDLMSVCDSDVTGAGWLARCLALRDAEQLGPFRLGLLETLVRVADWRGSANPNCGATS